MCTYMYAAQGSCTVHIRNSFTSPITDALKIGITHTPVSCPYVYANSSSYVYANSNAIEFS